MKYVTLARLSGCLGLVMGMIATGSVHAANTCSMWTDPAGGYAICLPDSWYHTVTPAGNLFLCDQRKGSCTEKGGNPLPGHATVSVLSMRDALAKTGAANVAAAPVTAAPATLEEFAHRVADADRSSKFSPVVTVTNPYVPIRYLLVSQTQLTAAAGDSPQSVFRYFVQLDNKMMEFWLTFNIGERKGTMYEDAVLAMIGSLQPKG